MFFQAAVARQELARHLATLNYNISNAAWQKLCMAIKRDLQAKRLRPNVPVPSRRNPVAFYRTMVRETGSVGQAIAAFAHDGAWTSSGGSFRLATTMGIDIYEEAERFLELKQRFTFLEIGAAWAGFRTPISRHKCNDIASMSDVFADEMGQRVFLHFTNLTPWHEALPEGVYEHPYVTAAGLRLLERQGVARGSVDIIYSQAAVYFETDHASFMTSAGRLLSEDGVLIFNHRPEIAAELDGLAAQMGLLPSKRMHLEGMNGDVVRYQRKHNPIAQLPILAADHPIQIYA